MYVGVTRAADLLFLTFARRRMILGRATGGFTAN
jgi:superfamily I DNA/RNA helicase